jgi:DNA-binding MarR family transcriptional regulator
MVGRMERDGLVKKRVDGVSRKVVIDLTRLGQRLVQRMRTELSDAQHRQLSRMTRKSSLRS